MAPLFEVPPEGGAWPTTPVTCVYGEPIEGPHPLCAARVARDILEFYEAVARGEYDAEGFTPRERAALAKRAKMRP